MNTSHSGHGEECSEFYFVDLVAEFDKFMVKGCDNQLEAFSNSCNEESCDFFSSTSLVHNADMDDPIGSTSQNNNDEKHALKSQLKVSDDDIIAALVHHDSTHQVIDDLYRKAQRDKGQDGIRIGSYVADLQGVKTTFEDWKSEYLCLLLDRDYLLQVAGKYAEQLREKVDEVNKLNRELGVTQGTLEHIRIALQEARNQIVVSSQYREQDDKERFEFFQEVIQELDSIQPTYDLDSCPKSSLGHPEFLYELDHFQAVDNSLFEMGVDLIIPFLC